MHLLIPYIPITNHVDPDFSEFTYGEGAERGRKFRMHLKPGDYVFFHTTLHNKKYITAYYIVDRVIDTLIASQDRAITMKYKNPHIWDCLKAGRPKHGKDDVVLFGDPIRSMILKKPLVFERTLAEKLSLNIKFVPGRTETQIVGSAARAHRKLTDKDVDILCCAIKKLQETSDILLQRSTEEVSQTLEKDIEDHLAHSPSVIARNLQLVARQYQVPSGRLDLLLMDAKGNSVVVELKLGRIGHDALTQIRRYLHDLRQEGKKANGIIVCEGVLPAYEKEFRQQKDVRVMIYGWNLNLKDW